MRRIHRVAWTEFPPVWIHAAEMSVKHHAVYRLAKAGDPDAAFHLLNDFISEAVGNNLNELLWRMSPVLVSVHAIEQTGVNAIPEALADLLAEQLHWRTESAIVQINIVEHTGADGFSRLARQALFDGSVNCDDVYILVDDFVGQGGTKT